MTKGAMRWRRTFFVHWRVPAELLQPRLPRGVTLDLWRGQAVASLVAVDIAGLFRCRQLNLRTYVEGAAGPGMTLLHTRIDRLSYALGARLAGMPYHLDRQLRFDVHTSSLEVQARGLSLSGLVAATPPETLLPGSLEHFAAERYRIYASLPTGRTWCVQVSHEPWRVRPVRLEQPLTPIAFDLALDAEPVSAHLCENVEVAVANLALPSEEAAAIEDDPSLAPA
jgi:uncharacterized protein YqjF (DUF2071 family)